MSAPPSPAIENPTRTPLQMSTPSKPTEMDTETFATPQLTPRSKVQALLASFSDDSDEEITVSRQNPQLSTGVDPPLQTGPSSASLIFNQAASKDAETSNDQTSAYERVRNQLMNPNTKEATPAVASDEPSTAVTNEGPAKAVSGENEPARDEAVAKPRRKLFTRPKILEKSSPIRRSVESGLDSSEGDDDSISSSPNPKQRNAILQLSDSSDSDHTPAEEEPDRFKALINRKREEARLKAAQEQEAREKKEQQRRERESSLLEGISDGGDSEDNEGGARLTQQARPTRKASKKAIEEMQRETQRMARNMQLSHEARTKKKITTQSLLDRFNYRTSASLSNKIVPHPAPVDSSTDVSPNRHPRSTPPTSPPSIGPVSHNGSPGKDLPASVAFNNEAIDNDDEDVLPDLEDVLAEMKSAGRNRDSDAKGENVGDGLDEMSSSIKATEPIQMGPKFKGKGKSRNLLPSRQEFFANRVQIESDDDIEVLPEGVDEKLSMWDKALKNRGSDNKELLTLRALAHLNSPSKRRVKMGKTFDLTELDVNLRRQARQQARREREARLQDLRDRGIIVQTAEEREKEEAVVEDLVAKARQEAQEITEKERQEAKDGKERRGTASLSGDSEEDEDWNEQKQASIQSASDADDESDDNEDIDSEEEEEDEENVPNAGQDTAMIDFEASEDEEDEEDNIDSNDEEVEVGDIVDDHETSPVEDDNDHFVADNQRKRKRAILDSDDEDSPPVPINIAKTPSKFSRDAVLKTPLKSVTPKSAQKIVIPGLPVTNDLSMGLTQIFAGTMDDSQSQNVDGDDFSASIDPNQDSLAFLQRFPGPELPSYNEAAVKSAGVSIPDSQDQGVETQNLQDSFVAPIDLKYSQAMTQLGAIKDSFNYDPTQSQYSEMPDPTQDKGFAKSSPIADRFDSPIQSTVDTIPALEIIPPAKKRRLIRRREARSSSSAESDDDIEVEPTEKPKVTKQAFDVMRKASKAKAPQDPLFDKKRSDAKGMVEEQAEESEDEYAGLGGMSDDESGTEDAEFNRQMVDDNVLDANDRQLAAFHADKERANDEKQVAKLFNDISKGLLRRKRGADYSLSDSDDDGEARRRRKRREFAKMRKALLADNKEVGKIANDPKKQAFLLAIEDRDPDEYIDILDEEEIPTMLSNMDSQVEGQSQPGETQSNEIASHGETSRLQEKKNFNEKQNEPRLPAHLRRTHGNRPGGLVDIKKTLSFLATRNGEEETVDLGMSSDVEPEEFAPHQSSASLSSVGSSRRSGVPNQMIDRISLLRQSSSSSSSNPTTPLAFASASTIPLFKGPSLLRRTTSSSTDSTGVTYGTERSIGAKEDKFAVRKPSGKGGSVNFNQRQQGRNSHAELSEKRHREMIKRKVAEGSGRLRKLHGKWN